MFARVSTVEEKNKDDNISKLSARAIDTSSSKANGDNDISNATNDIINDSVQLEAAKTTTTPDEETMGDGTITDEGHEVDNYTTAGWLELLHLFIMVWILIFIGSDIIVSIFMGNDSFVKKMLSPLIYDKSVVKKMLSPLIYPKAALSATVSFLPSQYWLVVHQCQLIMMMNRNEEQDFMFFAPFLDDHRDCGLISMKSKCIKLDWLLRG